MPHYDRWCYDTPCQYSKGRCLLPPARSLQLTYAGTLPGRSGAAARRRSIFMRGQFATIQTKCGPGDTAELMQHEFGPCWNDWGPLEAALGK
eukprot:3526114-Pyramimonas_sp.AAC.1